jgi:hypothetical protein
MIDPSSPRTKPSCESRDHTVSASESAGNAKSGRKLLGSSRGLELVVSGGIGNADVKPRKMRMQDIALSRKSQHARLEETTNIS